ncbi:MAG TPA: response regulator [Thermoanaerobaculia bacterium]|nr:response regulator [Thermoanaerobaculia bacterium]
MTETEPTRRVLLVDNDPAVVRTTGRLLRDAGFQVVEASSAKQAIDLLSGPEPFTCAVLDVVLDDAIDGTEIVSWIKVHHPAMHVVIASGKRGFTPPPGVTFLRKPYTIEEMRRAVVFGG